MATLKEQYNNKEGFYSNNALIANAVRNSFGSVDLDYVLMQFAPDLIQRLNNYGNASAFHGQTFEIEYEIKCKKEQVEKLKKRIEEQKSLIQKLKSKQKSR